MLPTESPVEKHGEEREAISMKIWRTADDEKVCSMCAALDGTTSGGLLWDASLGPETDLWKKGDDGEYHRKTTEGVLGGPPLHPNCRCQLEEVAG